MEMGIPAGVYPHKSGGGNDIFQMKTYKNLYSQIYDFQNLLKSYYQARKP